MDSVGAKSLIASIIKVAICDVKDCKLNIETSRNKRSAVKFLNSEDCKFYCEVLGIDYNSIKNFLKDRPELKRNKKGCSEKQSRK